MGRRIDNLNACLLDVIKHSTPFDHGSFRVVMGCALLYCARFGKGHELGHQCWCEKESCLEFDPAKKRRVGKPTAEFCILAMNLIEQHRDFLDKLDEEEDYVIQEMVNRQTDKTLTRDLLRELIIQDWIAAEEHRAKLVAMR